MVESGFGSERHNLNNCSRVGPRVATRVASRVGDTGGGTLAAAAALPHLSPPPRRRLSEWPAKPEAREDSGGGARGDDHHQSRRRHPRWRPAGATPTSKPALRRRWRQGRRRPASSGGGGGGEGEGRRAGEERGRGRRPEVGARGADVDGGRRCGGAHPRSSGWLRGGWSSGGAEADMEVGPWLGAGAGAAAFPASAQAQMVVQRELVTVGRLPRCRSAPSPFLELPPFFVGSF
uniref:Uncharacterized protein n=1 Tax=Oryza nivara TaxID=4536 RepID=A0A0E0FP83_ORYNI